jgi:hypothetical protein
VIINCVARRCAPCKRRHSRAASSPHFRPISACVQCQWQHVVFLPWFSFLVRLIVHWSHDVTKKCCAWAVEDSNFARFWAGYHVGTSAHQLMSLFDTDNSDIGLFISIVYFLQNFGI